MLHIKSTGQLSQIFIGSIIATKFAAWVDRPEAAATTHGAAEGEAADAAKTVDAEEGKSKEEGEEQEEEQEVVDGIL